MTAYKNTPQFKIVTSKPRQKSETDILLDKLIGRLHDGIDYFKDQQLPVRFFNLWLEFFGKLQEKRTDKDLLELFMEVIRRHEEWLGQLMNRLRQQESELRQQKELYKELSNRNHDLSDQLSALESLLARRDKEIANTQHELDKQKTLEARMLAAEKALKPVLADNASLLIQIKGLAAQLEKVPDLEARAFGAETALERSRAEIIQLRTEIKEMRNRSAGSNLAEIVKSVADIGANEVTHLDRMMNVLSEMRSGLADSISRLADTASNGQPRPAQQIVQGFTDVQPEIDRRTLWLNEVKLQIITLGEDREEVAARIEEMSDLIKYADGNTDERKRFERKMKGLDKQLTGILASEQEVREQLLRLQNYQKAIETVKDGVPPEIIGQDLPELSGESDTPEPILEPVIIGSENERFQQLSAIGERYGLNPYGTFVISLYECLPHSRKSTMSLIAAAMETGLIARFGLPSKMEIYENWRASDKPELEYLHFGGKFAGGIYYRNRKPLDWNIQQLFTDEEKKSFCDFIEAAEFVSREERKKSEKKSK